MLKKIFVKIIKMYPPTTPAIPPLTIRIPPNLISAALINTTLTLVSLIIATPFFTTTASAKIMITEALPNPDGTDKDKEWVEIYNNENTSVNLENWQIKNNKSPQNLENFIIPAKSFGVLNNLKFSLKNTNEEVKLINPQGEIIDQIKYENAPAGQSYSKIIIKNKNQKKYEWIWTNPTKNFPNQILYQIEGFVKDSPRDSTPTNTFTIISENQKLQIKFNQNPVLMKAILQKGTQIQILAEKFEHQKFILKNIKIIPPRKFLLQNTQPKKPSENWLLYSFIPTMALLFALIKVHHAQS